MIALQMHPGVLLSHRDAMLFDGRTKDYLSDLPTPQFVGDDPCDSYVVCGLAQGAFLLDSDVFFRDLALYYGVSVGTQVVEVRSDARELVLINAINFASVPTKRGVPCSLRGLTVPLFRIRGRNPTEIYCVTERIEGDRHGFKSVYEDAGLKGLNFQEVWTGEAQDINT
ncbi:MAG TPA: hypothetical protein VK157_09920 [Phycisphaerales bacterium]|nr:hypothetical protein [Phycisphaerales bacterium]